jgi:N-ethylmaleimide reductase
MMKKLLEPAKFGALNLKNRIVMAPMTRNRATVASVPTAVMAEYYAQRADAGLIVVEGTSSAPEGISYIRMPGVWSNEQIDAWAKVNQAIKGNDGLAVLQLMHGGRISSVHNKPYAGVRTVAPSAVRAAGEVWTDAAGMQNFDTPVALTNEEVKQTIAQYGNAAKNAISAGFAGVEFHCTSGYLPMQFIGVNSNLRQDEYGGDLTGRLRFPVECMLAMADAIGADRVGIRVCPGNPFNDIEDPDPVATYTQLLKNISHLPWAYLHIMKSPLPQVDAFKLAKDHFKGAIILNDGFTPETAEEALVSGLGDAVSFARSFIGNPDLVNRIRLGQGLSKFDRKTLYTDGREGYSDYPSFSG